MPNWCSNNLEVRSKKFIDFIKTKNKSEYKISTMLYCMYFAKELGIENFPEKLFYEFCEYKNTKENLSKVEKTFNHYAGFRKLFNGGESKLLSILKMHSFFNGPKEQFNLMKKAIKNCYVGIEEDNKDIKKEYSFSLFDYVERDIKFFLLEDFQFFLPREETNPFKKELIEADVRSANTTNLGTKWDASDCFIVLDEEKDLVDIAFRTAWSPPEPIIRRIGEIYANDGEVLHVYAEQGAAYCGQIEYENGIEIENIESEFKIKSDDDLDDDDFQDLSNWKYDTRINLEVLEGDFGG